MKSSCGKAQGAQLARLQRETMPPGKPSYPACTTLPSRPKKSEAGLMAKISVKIHWPLSGFAH